MNKPELLLPAGSVEAFYAALKGGADAIYLGLQDFNARKRASNFTINQLPQIVELAHKNRTKIYITLNTVIKNDELPQLYTLLYQLSQIKIDAIIIQDWGILHLAKKYFPKMEIHASTQMAFHNSPGVNFGKKSGLSRIILARELTFKELSAIRSKTKAEIELFVHGALCYSFSGMCLFSSYLGGMSANRGACKQPCRRMYTDNHKKHYIFNLKDNELIEFVPELSKLGIDSLKIEGRMKSADYVYTIARAYRMVIDDHSQIEEAKKILVHDISRDKTSYFMGGNVSEAITEKPNTGVYIGKVIDKTKNAFTFQSSVTPNEIRRLRVCSPDWNKQINMKLKEFIEDGDKISIKTDTTEIDINDLVYVSGFESQKFPAKLRQSVGAKIKTPGSNEAKNKTTHLVKPQKRHRNELFFRIDSLAWLRKIRLDDVEHLVLKLPVKEWSNIPLETKFLAKNKHKLIVELPKFIMEENYDKYVRLSNQLFKKSVTRFMIGHISQVALLPDQAQVISNENVYAFNDAAVAQLKRMRIQNHVYPLENDLVNLLHGKDRSGIVPLHFTPQLFYSRMPVKTINESGNFKDDTNIDYHVEKREGVTITLPNKPVSLFQNKQDLIKRGFRQFLIDVSFTPASQNTFKTLIKRYFKGEQVQPSTSFNFKKGLN